MRFHSLLQTLWMVRQILNNKNLVLIFCNHDYEKKRQTSTIILSNLIVPL